MIKPYVLVVDDAATVDEVCAALEGHYECLGLTTVEDALFHLSEEQVDVLVVGGELAGDTGTELLAQAADVSPLTCRIVMSGQAEASFLLRAINVARVTHFISKPVEPTLLLAAISEALVARGRSREALTSILLGQRLSEVQTGKSTQRESRTRPPGWPEHLVEDLGIGDAERLAWFLDANLHIGVALMSPADPQVDVRSWAAELELRLVTSLRETDHCFRVSGRGFLVLFGHTSRSGCRSAGRRFGNNLSGGVCLQTMQWPDDAAGGDPLAFAHIVLSQT